MLQNIFTTLYLPIRRMARRKPVFEVILPMQELTPTLQPLFISNLLKNISSQISFNESLMLILIMLIMLMISYKLLKTWVLLGLFKRVYGFFTFTIFLRFTRRSLHEDWREEGIFVYARYGKLSSYTIQAQKFQHFQSGIILSSILNQAFILELQKVPKIIVKDGASNFVVKVLKIGHKFVVKQPSNIFRFLLISESLYIRCSLI